MRFAESFSTNVLQKNADTWTVRQLLTIALDWIEAQATMDRDMVAASLQRQLAECEPACRAACLAVHPAHTIELNGPAGDYPLALGLALLAAESGKPWGFIVQPQNWTSTEWQRVTDTVAHLKDRPIFYRTGFKTVSLTTGLAV